MFFRIISILLMQKQIPLCLLAIVLSVSLFGQNLKADKIILSDSDLTNLYQIDSGVYRSEQPSKEGFKALEKYGIGEVLNLRNRHSDDDEAKGTSIKLHRVKTKAYRIIFQNVSKEDAIHEMTEGGYGFHRIYKNIIRRIKEANVEQIRKEVMEGGEL